ncbi:protein FAR1-RELATED SEQUENCE 5-like isoform X1 [Trifolium pratense]|uniref:protein FAR1-RELATED SEQUENCE 5-like isoform X1 n=2 Tax=Trifolium pratense TaxID=57577 RepID=UPI001E6939D9|nr:protein FAR1-RELATED SEQUENCE 5-like isoform X1 [Trifolium pratense]
MLCYILTDFKMESYRDVDVHSTETDSSDASSETDAEHNSSENSEDGDGYVVSSADQSSDDEDVAHNDDDEDAFEATTGDKFLRVDSMTVEEIRALEFVNVAEAYEFYYQYGKCKGFAIRKRDVRRRGPKGSEIIVMNEFVCNKHGSRNKKHLIRVDRKREHRRLTRTQCGARLRVLYKKNKDKYVVSLFEETHNHELTPAKYVHLHPVYRNLSESDRAQVDGLQSHGIRTCHIMGYMVAQKGGYTGVGFTKKDLYNYFDKKMRSAVKDGDVSAALNYLNVKSSTDPMLYAEYSVDGNGRMKTLFWADGTSRSDYFCFGDVVAFDTTYGKNKYNYPLVIFSGCNHHLQSVIFASALVSDETTETYKWLLNTFLECMNNQYPTGVVTDGDGAMREAIKQIFPDSTHRLCAWHLNKNAGENVKNVGFLRGFQKAMYSNFTVEEFEEFWSELLKETELESHPWVVKTYENRSLWATAYLREKFFGRIRTTSQCEAINAIIKNYVRKKGCIYEFMHNFEQALVGYRNNELVADFNSKFTDPVLSSHLHLLESHAAKTYTAAVFKEVKEQIMKVAALIVKERFTMGDTLIFILKKYCQTGFERQVAYDISTQSFQCSCRLFESRGLPCSHMFYVLKEESIDHIPASLILNRWTKDAKVGFLNMNSTGDLDSKMMEQARFGAYCSAFTTFCKEASKRNGVFGDVMGEIMKLHHKYCEAEDPIVPTEKTYVGDPMNVKSKGAPKKKKNAPKTTRHCGYCQSTIHDARNCPERLDSTDEEDFAVDSVSGNDSLSKIQKRCKKKARGDYGSRAKKKCSQTPQSETGQSGNVAKTRSSRQKKCSQKPQSETFQSVNVTTTRRPDIRTRQVSQMFRGQPMTPVGEPVIHPMPIVQPMYPMYGMPTGENSNHCFGVLQQVMKFGGQN